MKNAPSSDEKRRLNALAEYRFVSAATDKVFDNITWLTAHSCATSGAMINVSDRHQQWLIAAHGVSPPQELPDEQSFSVHVNMPDKILEINDAKKDHRFRNHPLVKGKQKIRFYAGVLLLNPEGIKIGTLAVVDKKPKVLTAEQKEILLHFAHHLILLFEVRRKIMNDALTRKNTADALKKANMKLGKQLHEQSQSSHEIILLGEMSNLLQSCVTTKEAYAIVDKLSRQIFPKTSGSLYLLAPSHQQLELATYWGNPLTQQPTFTPEDCWGLRRGQAHFMSDPTKDLACSHVLTKGPLTPIYFCLPLLAQSKTLGLLYLEFPKTLAHTKNAHMVENQRLLAIAMAEQIALALANIRLRETLRYQSIHDALTGLYNRRYLTDKLALALSEAKTTNSTVAVIMVDIDFFKHFNDEYSHEAGDKVLIEIAKLLLTNTYPKAKELTCRMGGEEFLMVLPKASLKKTLQRAQKIHQGTQQISLQYKGRTLDPVTLSLGVALFPEDADNAGDLLRAVDKALYHAKETGRNKVITYSQTKTNKTRH